MAPPRLAACEEGRPPCARGARACAPAGAGRSAATRHERRAKAERRNPLLVVGPGRRERIEDPPATDSGEARHRSLVDCRRRSRPVCDEHGSADADAAMPRGSSEARARAAVAARLVARPDLTAGSMSRRAGWVGRVPQVAPGTASLARTHDASELAVVTTALPGCKPRVCAGMGRGRRVWSRARRSGKRSRLDARPHRFKGLLRDRTLWPPRCLGCGRPLGAEASLSGRLSFLQANAHPSHSNPRPSTRLCGPPSAFRSCSTGRAP
eukprot:361808-Chlamydomonas_euryale.AAC.6